jgi:hypothetical protein
LSHTESESVNPPAPNAFGVIDYADYITGTNLYIDGGMTLYPGFEAGG